MACGRGIGSGRGRIGRFGQTGALRGRGRGFGYTVTEVIEVSDLDLGLGQALAFIGALPARQRGCATTSSIRRASARRSTDTSGYGDLPAGPSRRPARPASGTAPTEDGEAAVPLPNLRVLRRAEEHARVAHHQETSPGEWKPGHEGVATALSAPASHSVRTPSL